MKLNLEYYISKENNVPEAEYKKIEKFIEQYEEKDYEEKIELIDSNNLQYFTTIGQNILNWYSFSSNSSVLEIGGNFGEITGVLCKNANEVVTIEENLRKAEIISKRHKDKENLEIIVGKFDNIDFKGKKFDYITLIGSLPYTAKSLEITSKEFIKRIEELLKPNGKLLIAVDNRFGIRYFAGNPDAYLNKKFVTLLNYNNEEEKIETYTRQKLIKILDECGYVTKNFYYPLPDYRMPNVIFSDLELPKYNNIGKYIPYATEKTTILVDEIDLLREILKEDEKLFTFFANSYFIEASKEDVKHQYKYISYNNIRKPDYRLITKIGNEYVYKECVDENSSKHYENIISNLEILKKSNINTLDEVDNKEIKSKYVEQDRLLSVVLNNKLEENNLDEFYKILDKYFETLKISSEKMDINVQTIFDNYGIKLQDELRKELNFLKHGLWDMTLKNCFYIDDEFYFFDQEWNCDNMPAEYILYRSIMYTISLRRFINIDDILSRYGLDRFLNIFKELDEKLQEEIRDEKIWKYYSENKYFDIDATRQEMINMGIRDKDKDKAIEYLQKRVNELENESLMKGLRRKAIRWIRRRK